MKSITVSAILDELTRVQEFIGGQLEEAGCPMKAQMQIQIAVEEIFVNIARYAYGPEGGQAIIRCEAASSPGQVCIEFEDGGRPFNPLEKEDADTTLSAEERKIGGLGILMVKRSMDQVAYAFERGRNRFTMKKNW